MSLLDQTQLTIRPVSMAASELVYLRHILEACEGLGFVVGTKGGDVLLVSTHDRAHELDEFISDMKNELKMSASMTSAHLEVLHGHQ